MNSSATDSPGETEVFTLLVVAGRWPSDDLPKDATAARLLCYAAAGDEAEAVRETVYVLRDAGVKPLDVIGYGSRSEREAEGDLADEERELLDRAQRENAVIVAEVTPVYGDDDVSGAAPVS